ncbi:hypothetical protein WMY93_027032 [Mugilogobius chulae]|uniref:C2H2-type domain-containing protein n=1 Tax=Mugilogobius chulae TaxID=88201 RepID=A0AAW0N421_9GOBI
MASHRPPSDSARGEFRDCGSYGNPKPNPNPNPWTANLSKGCCYYTARPERRKGTWYTVTQRAVWTQPSQSLYLDGLSGHSQVRVCIWMGCLDTAKSEMVVREGCLYTARPERLKGTWYTVAQRAVWTQPSQSLYLDGLSGHSQVRDGCQGGLSGHSRVCDGVWIGCLDTAKVIEAESEFVSGWAVWTQPSQSLCLDGLSGHSQVRVCIWMGCLDTAKSEMVVREGCLYTARPERLKGTWYTVAQRAVWTQPSQSLYLDGLSGHSQVRDGCQGGLSGHSRVCDGVWIGCLDTAKVIEGVWKGCLYTARPERLKGTWYTVAQRAVSTQPIQSLYLDGLSEHSRVRVCIWMGCLDTADPSIKTKRYLVHRRSTGCLDTAKSDPRTTPHPLDLSHASSTYATPIRTTPRPLDIRHAHTTFATPIRTTPRPLDIHTPPRPTPRPLDLSHAHTNYATPLDLSHASTTYAPPPRHSPRPYDLRHASTTYATPPRPKSRLLDLRHAHTTYATPPRPKSRLHELRHAHTTYATPPRPKSRLHDLRHAHTTYATPPRPKSRLLDLRHAHTTFATPIRTTPRPLDIRHAHTNYAPPLDIRHAHTTYATPIRTTPRPLDLSHASSTYATPIRPSPRPYELRPAPSTFATPIRTTPRPLDIRHAHTTYATPIRTTPRPLDLSHASTTYATPIRPKPRPYDLRPAPLPKFLSLSQPIRGREIFVTSPEHVSQPVPANQVSAAECSMQSGRQAGRQADGCEIKMTKPKRGHRCPICSKFLNNVSQHLRNIHRVKNSEERKILNDLASGFTAIPPGLCPEEGCSSKIGHVAKHLKRHKDISKSRMEELLETARRETAIKLLSNLRSTQPTPPMVSRLDALSHPCENSACLQREEDIKTLMQRNHHLEKELAELKRKMSSQPSMTEAPFKTQRLHKIQTMRRKRKKRRRRRRKRRRRRRRKRMRWRRGRRRWWWWRRRTATVMVNSSCRIKWRHCHIWVSVGCHLTLASPLMCICPPLHQGLCCRTKLSGQSLQSYPAGVDFFLGTSICTQNAKNTAAVYCRKALLQRRSGG